jgi:hypothetical protein
MWEKLRAKHEQIGPQVVWSCLFGIFQETRYQEGSKLEDHLAKMMQYFTRLGCSWRRVWLVLCVVARIRAAV